MDNSNLALRLKYKSISDQAKQRKFCASGNMPPPPTHTNLAGYNLYLWCFLFHQNICNPIHVKYILY